MPVVCVYSPFTSRVSRRYYCFFCWDVISARAAKDVAGLQQDGRNEAVAGEQDAQFIGVLMGITEPTPERHLGEFVAVNLDLRIEFPVRLMVGRVPFAQYYPTGTDRIDHIAESRRRLGRDDG